MNISIKGVKVSISEAMKDEFVSRVEALGEKYFGKVISASIAFEKIAGDQIEAKISIHPAEKKEFFAHSSADLMKDAFSDTLHKLDIQLNKDHAKSVEH